MILIVAVDEHNGLTFNQRRQSQDRVLREKMLSITEGKRLWMDSYSVKQFDLPLAPQIIVDDDYFHKAGPEDFCFFERGPLPFCEGQIQQIILFHWNRSYPGDTYFELDLDPSEWVLLSTEEFAGYSHDKITMEVWNHAKEKQTEK